MNSTLQKTTYALGGAAFALIAGLATQQVSAQMRGDTTNLSSALATKLNLPAETVSTALDSVRTEERTARQAENRAAYESELTAAVTAGKLTEAQKQLLLTKHDEIRTKLTELHDQRETLMTDYQTWATENGIDSQYLQGREGGGRGEKGGKGGGMGGRMMR